MNDDQKLQQAGARFLKEASDQSFRLKVIKEQAAQEIARMYDIRSKPHDPAAFVDIAMQLLTYPPELGFVVAQEFTGFAPMLGFQPYGTILVTIGHIDSLYSGMIVSISHLRKNPQMGVIMDSKPERLSRAARLLVTGLLLSTQSSSEARGMFTQISADPSIKERMRSELAQNGLAFVADDPRGRREMKSRWKFW